MYYLEATALRIGSVIEVTISGSLANSCWEASVKDFYPGGNIVYAIDPGHAQVFISEEVRPGSQFCTLALVPWLRTVAIPDTDHESVQIFINGKKELKVEVQDSEIKNNLASEQPSDDGKFRVIALTASVESGYSGCSIILADAFYPAIYSSVFGPDTLENCKAWVSENCSAQTMANGDLLPWPW